MRKNITKRYLLKVGACSEAVQAFEELGEIKIEVKKALTLCVKMKHFNWANWLIVRLLNKKQKVMYAIYAAEQVIKAFENQFPQDERPRKAIEVAKAYLNNPRVKTKVCANAAAVDAANAADAAYAAALDAANAAAAVDAAYAAVAAYVAAAAANAAAAYVAAANGASAVYAAAAVTINAAYAAKKQFQRELIAYGIKISA